ncbi:MAG TPA: YceI family protein [Baekduia sp.]|nr:YceI family protein [Baekduia sp.]
MATADLQPEDRAIGMTDRPRLPQALGERIDIMPVVDYLRPHIVAAEGYIEAHCELPSELVEELCAVGFFWTVHPRELDGLELHPHDYLDLLYEIARISPSVAWVGMIQNGALPLLDPELMQELKDKAGGRLIFSGSHGRIGKAYPVEGGYRFTGHWAFASGAPWATYITAYAYVMGPDDQPLQSPFGGPMYVDGIFPKAEVNYIGGWDPLGMRGTGSGQFTLEDAFCERRMTNTGIHESYRDRALFRSGSDQGINAVLLGGARGAIDVFTQLANAKVTRMSWADRAGKLGSEQWHQMNVAKADAMLNAAKAWTWDLAARNYEGAFSKDAQAAYDRMVEAFQMGAHIARTSKDVVSLMFDIAGADSVVRGRGLERFFRDVHTGAQHTMMLENNWTPGGQYLLTRDQPSGAQIDPSFTLFPPPPPSEAEAHLWRVDPLHSTVEFQVKHNAVGSFRSYFSEFDATYNSDTGTLTGSVTTTSLETSSAELKEYLLGTDQLDAQQYPEVTFKSDSVTVGEGGIVTIVGDLTLKGVTKAITATGTIVGPSIVEGFGADNEHIGLNVSTTIDRRDFGMDSNSELLDGQLNLGWDVTLEFLLEFYRVAQDG